MKIVIFSRFPVDVNNPRGGVESATLGLIFGLADLHDVDIHVVTLEKLIKTISVEKIGNITIHRLPGSRWPMLLDILGGPGKKRLMRYIDYLKPDVIHFQETYGLVKPKTKTPYVFTLHGFDSLNLITEKKWLWKIRSKLWKWIELYGLTTQTNIISINPYVKKQMQDYTGANIIEIENAISKDYFDIEHREIEGRVFFSGWINPRKNLLTILKAINELKAQGYNVCLHVAGEASDDKYYEEITAYIDNNNLKENVILLGRIDQVKMRHELSEASIFMLPSYQENAPMSIAEALAIGVPVISSTRCGMPYMIREGVTGFLTEPDDYSTMSKYIIRLVSDNENRKIMSNNCKEIARNTYHPDAVASKTYNLYKKISAKS